MKDILNTTISTHASGPLTLEMLIDTMAAARRPRPPHAHLIAASAKPGAVVMCAGCGAPVRVPEGWGKR